MPLVVGELGPRLRPKCCARFSGLRRWVTAPSRDLRWVEEKPEERSRPAGKMLPRPLPAFGSGIPDLLATGLRNRANTKDFIGTGSGAAAGSPPFLPPPSFPTPTPRPQRPEIEPLNLPLFLLPSSPRFQPVCQVGGGQSAALFWEGLWVGRPPGDRAVGIIVELPAPFLTTGRFKATVFVLFYFFTSLSSPENYGDRMCVFFVFVCFFT